MWPRNARFTSFSVFLTEGVEVGISGIDKNIVATLVEFGRNAARLRQSNADVKSIRLPDPS
jgi:hypothetical protein